MNLLRSAVKSHVSARMIKPSYALPSFLRESPKRFSTESDQPQTPQPDASVDQFLESASKGFVYAKLLGTAKYTMTSDVMNLLEGCNLTADDIKVNYNRTLFPNGMVLRFSSPAAFSNALRKTRRFDRFYKWEKVDAYFWDILTPYNGKTIVLEGVPRAVTMEDIERFLSRCDYDPSSIQTFLAARPGTNTPIRFITVQFPSKVQAMNAFINKNRSPCLNFPISVRVLH